MIGNWMVDERIWEERNLVTLLIPRALPTHARYSVNFRHADGPRKWKPGFPAGYGIVRSVHSVRLFADLEERVGGPT